MSRILEIGPGGVSDVELVAAVLAGTGRRERPEAVAARLLEGGLLRLRRMTLWEILRDTGVRPAQAARLAAALELGRRAAAADVRQRERLMSPDQMAAVYPAGPLPMTTIECFSTRITPQAAIRCPGAVVGAPRA